MKNIDETVKELTSMREGMKDNDYFYKLASLQKECIEKQKAASVSIEEFHQTDAWIYIRAINEIFYKKVENYIAQYLKQTYPTYIANGNMEEMLNECVCYLCSTFQNYDGKCAIVTFAKRNIQHSCSVYISAKTGMSRYDNEIATKVNRAENALLSQGFSIDDISDGDIQKQLPKLTLAQIKSARKMKSYAQREEYNPEVIDANKMSQSPESKYLEKENEEWIESVMDSLLPHERYVLSAKIGEMDAKRHPYKDIGLDYDFINLLKECGMNALIEFGEVSYKVPNPIEGKKRLSITKEREFVPADKVKAIYSKAINKAKTNPLVSACFDKQRALNGDLYGESVNLCVREDAEKNMDILNNVEF